MARGDRQHHGNALPRGHRLREFRIDGVLGQGGFGITYEAFDLALERPVAIKEYLPVELAVREADSTVRPFTQDRAELFAWGLDRFIAEGRTLARLDHPSIVRVHAVFEEHATAYLVMPFEAGRPLDDLAKFGRLSDEAALLSLVHDLLDGLEHVHAAGFLHRDIKPDNVFVRDDGAPVLIDFGSARVSLGKQARTKMTTVVSPGYAPYEQYQGDASRQGPWTDLYGLAATIYAVVSRGTAPTDALARADARLQGAADPLLPARSLAKGSWSPLLLAAIDAALAFQPEERPRDVAAWRAMLPPRLAPTVADAAARTIVVAPEPSTVGPGDPGAGAATAPMPGAPTPRDPGEGFGHGDPEPVSRYLVPGLLTFWIWTVLVLARRMREHASDRAGWFRAALGARAEGEQAHALLERGFRPSRAVPAACAVVYAAVAVLVVVGFTAFVLLGVDAPPRVKVLGAGLASLLFYFATVAFTTWAWRHVKRHELCELKLLELAHDPATFAPARVPRGFSARWEPIDNRIGLFLVVAAPIAFSPAVGMWLFHRNLTLAQTVLLPFVVFGLAGVFHLWGTRTLVTLWNRHLEEEARSAGTAH